MGLTVQNTPRTAPHNMANRTVSSKDVAGNQRPKHKIPHRKVNIPAVATLDVRSLMKPIIGRPTVVPRFRKPTMSVALVLGNPMARAKSDKENNRAMYPNMLTKAQRRRSKTFLRRRRVVIVVSISEYKSSNHSCN